MGKLRAAHWLKCPKCGHNLQAPSMEDIELETCIFCAGMHFDRGELESLLLLKLPQRLKFYRRFLGSD